MKLFEVEDPNDNLVLLLRNMVQQANSQKQPSYLSWSALGNLMQNMNGQPLSYDSFRAAYDSNPDLFKNLVHNYDGRGITLKTHAKDPKQAGPSDGEKTITKMAKAATARRRG